jgi:hypothetical protein
MLERRLNHAAELDVFQKISKEMLRLWNLSIEISHMRLA